MQPQNGEASGLVPEVLHAVGGLTPIAALAIGPVVAVPDGVILGLAVVAPVATVGLFLVDVGRELLADR